MRHPLRFPSAVLAAAVIVGLGSGLANRTDAALLENLAYSASGSGTQPAATLSQGSSAGIFDGSMFTWGSGSGTSPRVGTGTSLAPYMTWSADQTIRSVRVFFDHKDASPKAYDRLAIDTLTLGGNPAIEADWIQRSDTSTGYAKPFLDADLGGDFVTRGVRVRASTTTADINVGEVAVFKPLLVPGGTLSANRIAPTGATGSSDSGFGRPVSNVNDAYFVVSSKGPPATGWYADFLSGTPAANPGDRYTVDVSLTPDSAVNGVSVTFGAQSGFAAIPSQWTLYADRGSGFFSLGTFSATAGRMHYYHDL